MTTGIYLIWDTKAQARFGGVMLTPNDIAAVRGFVDICNDKDPRNFLKRHPEDFELRKVGYLDDTGLIRPWNDETDPTCSYVTVYTGLQWYEHDRDVEEQTPQLLNQQAMFHAGMRAMAQQTVNVPDNGHEKRPWWRFGR